MAGGTGWQADRTAARGSHSGVQFHQISECREGLYRLHAREGKLDKWLSGARGYLTHTLNAYDNSPVWTADPKNQVFSQASKRALPASGIGTPGEKAATAIADFLVVDMFANYCTGREDAKGAIAIAERQLKRIYR